MDYISEIQDEAYKIWLSEGSPLGYEKEYWHRAKKVVDERIFWRGLHIHVFEILNENPDPPAV